MARRTSRAQASGPSWRWAGSLDRARARTSDSRVGRSGRKVISRGYSCAESRSRTKLWWNCLNGVSPTVRQPVNRMTEAAVSMLLERVADPETFARLLERSQVCLVAVEQDHPLAASLQFERDGRADDAGTDDDGGRRKRAV